jgi:hypothetical protein
MDNGTMPIESPIQLLTALADGRFSDLIGTSESDWLEFKQSPYQLETRRGKYQLAKDAAGFANSNEAYIVIGVATTRHEFEVVDAAEKVCLVPKSLIDATQYRDVIASWIYPQIRNISVQWFPHDSTVARGIFVIGIGPQASRDRYFIVRRLYQDDGEEATGLAVPIRNGDRTYLLSPEDVHRHLSEGLRAELGPPTATGHSVAPERLDERLQQIEAIQDWESEAVMYLLAIPNGESTIRDFFSRGGMWGALSNPPSLRRSGFNLRTWQPAHFWEDALIAQRPGDLILLLEPSGLFIAGAAAHREFLGWAINDRRSDDQLRINPIALVEFTLEFFRFVDLEVKSRLIESAWRFQVRCSRFRERRVTLGHGSYNWLAGASQQQGASTDIAAREFRDRGDYRKNAWEALARVYALHDLPTEAIPYAEEDAISEEAIVSLG